MSLGLQGGDTRLADGLKLGGTDHLILCLVHAGDRRPRLIPCLKPHLFRPQLWIKAPNILPQTFKVLFLLSLIIPNSHHNPNKLSD